MDKTLLEKLVNDNLSLREIVKVTGIPQTTVRAWLKRYGLKTNLEVGNKGASIRKHGSEWYCKTCGENDKNKFYRCNKSRCSRCTKKEVLDRFRENKRLAVEYKGGKCEKCGYGRCQAALDFHHLNSAEKDPNWKNMKSWKLDDIKAELDKCMLVCRNCHSEIHFTEESENEES